MRIPINLGLTRPVDSDEDDTDESEDENYTRCRLCPGLVDVTAGIGMADSCWCGEAPFHRCCLEIHMDNCLYIYLHASRCRVRGRRVLRDDPSWHCATCRTTCHTYCADVDLHSCEVPRDVDSHSGVLDGSFSANRWARSRMEQDPNAGLEEKNQKQAYATHTT